MNTKTKYMIPAFAAVFALIFALGPTSVMAEGDDNYAKWGDEKHFKKGHHAILVEGFSGTIVLSEELNRDSHDALKEQVTVSLKDAVSVAEDNGLEDAMKAGIGVVKDEDGNKYLVWKVASMERDSGSESVTANIFVVDAGNASNFATVTKTFDHYAKDRMHGDMNAKFDKLQERFSEPTGDAEVDAARAQFLDLMQQLREAYSNGDTETAESLKKQLSELKQTFLDVRNGGF